MKHTNALTNTGKVRYNEQHMKPSLLTKLSKLIEGNPAYIVEGKLNKNLLAADARKYDSNLLNTLQKDKEIKEHFFTETDGGLVFKKDVFLQFISNKQFLPDSFTKYKIKIGLGNDDGSLLAENGDVVLNWPYKDAILEGGQDKEDQKRNEVFFNEVLAPDQITRLLDDKVFTNWKRFDKGGEHELDELKDNDNLIIKGNNLVVLHSLKKRFAGKVKLIYIDPPYNTEGDGFNYNDRFNHSTWLTFIKNRLDIARFLLRRDGLIFIHVSDKELHYLKVLIDGIMPNRFVATIPRKTRSGKSDVPYNMSQDFDWMLVYAGTEAQNDKLLGRVVERKYHTSGDYPDDAWRLADLTKQTTAKERPNSAFDLVNPKNGDVYPFNPNRTWSINPTTFKKYYDLGKIVFPGDYDFLNITKPAMRVFRSEDEASEKKTYVSTNFLNITMDTLLQDATNSKGTDDMNELFGEKAFSYPKNEILMQSIIEATTAPGDIVLDFFVGSGTTAAVAHKLGRQYIGVEQMNYIGDITLSRMQKVIMSDNAGISSAVNWQGGGSFVYTNIMNNANTFRERIEKAKNDTDYIALLNEAASSSFLSYRVDPSKLNEDEFRRLSPAEKRQLLLELIDNNTLYVNYEDINDPIFKVGDSDKKFNNELYKKSDD
jgi:adenine-specific DNA-methyltransferase